MDDLSLNSEVMSLKDWLITFLITAIPLVGLIMLFVWGFSDSTNESKKNWAKALLIFYLIVTVIYVVIGISFMGAIMSGSGA